MKLYFGNAVTTATTLMILALLGYIGVSVWNRGNIVCWGRRTLLLLVFGLVVCCFSAARDGWTRPSSTPSTAAARRACFRSSAFRPSSAVPVRC